MEWPAHLPLVRGGGVFRVVSENKYWQPCMFKLRVHTYEVIHSIKQLIFCKYNTMSGRGRRGRPRKVIPVVPKCPAVPVRDEHVVGSTTAYMNQPPAVGQAGPSGPPEGAQVPIFFYGRAGGTDCSDSSHSDRQQL